MKNSILKISLLTALIAFAATMLTAGPRPTGPGHRPGPPPPDYRHDHGYRHGPPPPYRPYYGPGPRYDRGRYYYGSEGLAIANGVVDLVTKVLYPPASVVVAPAPVVVAPQPVVMAPQPVVVAPQPVIVPQQVVLPPPAPTVIYR